VPLIAPVASQNEKSGSTHVPVGHVAAGFGFVHEQSTASAPQTNIENNVMTSPFDLPQLRLRNQL
jgi:hypothetical protein